MIARSLAAVAAVVALSIAAYAVAPRALPSAPPARPVRPDAATGGRIRYPAQATPVLTTADGTAHPVRSVLDVPSRMRFGDFVWNDAGVPDGTTWVRVDLATQTLSVFRAGHEIGTAVILYGTDDTPTPTGVFPILERKQQHRSSLYDAEMPYMLRLTHDGVAIHASRVRRGSATHGCIGIPEDFARKLFNAVRRGTPVAIERTA